MPNLVFENVMKVYSGKHGCMCGCQGKYTVNSNYVEQANAERGYPYDEDEVNDRVVKGMLTKMKKMVLLTDEDEEDNYVFAETDNRIYVAWFV